MNSIKIISLLLILFSNIYNQDLSILYEKIKPAIVSIECHTSNNEKKLGSGFFISKNGIIITNYHIIENAEKIFIKTINGQLLEDIKIGKYNTEQDLVALKIEGNSFNYLNVPTNPKIKIGNRVVAIGNPLGLEYTISEGIISGLRYNKDQNSFIIQTTAPISPGSSGGPLLLLDGNVIGVTTFQITEGQNLNFAIPIGEFIKKIEESEFLSLVEWRRLLIKDILDEKFNLVQKDLSVGLLKAAKLKLLEILDLDKENLNALYLLSKIMIDEWDNYNALKYLNYYTMYDSLNAEIYELMGIAYDRIGITKKAIQCFQRALTLNDNLVIARYKLIVLWIMENKIELIKEHIKKLKEQDYNLYLNIRDIINIDE